MVVEPMADSLPSIFKLSINCFKDIFEYLSLKEIKALRQTSKRLKRVIDYYITMNYARAFQKIHVDHSRLEYFRHAKITGFEFVNHMKFSYGEFNRSQIKGMQRISIQLESIEVDHEFFNCDYFEVLLNNCSRLKH